MRYCIKSGRIKSIVPRLGVYLKEIFQHGFKFDQAAVDQ